MGIWISSLGQQARQNEDDPFINPYKYNPLKAALLSAALPGAGQIYNKKLWFVRLPVIYGGFLTLGLIIGSSHARYIDSRNALIYALDNDETTTPEQINVLFANSTNESLRSNREFFRYNRDLTIIFTVLWYGINVAEAAVTAHLLDFDVSDDLSARIRPSVKQTIYSELVPTLTVTFMLR